MSWSKEVFEAGWQALQVKYVDTPMYLEHARAEYIDQRENWYVGSSPVGIPSGAPAESAAKMLKDVTNHKLTTLPQFIQNELPKLPKIWGSGCEGFSGRAPQPEPWMWQEAQAILHSKRFYDAGEALFIHQGSTTKKGGRAGMRVREYPPITADEVAQLIVFLLSPASSYITGTEIVIDGGLGSSNNQPNIPGIFAAM